MTVMPRRRTLLAALAASPFYSASYAAMPTASDLKTAFASTGKLRASINLGNPILARADGASAAGVSVDIARELAKRLGVEAELLVVDTAGKSVDLVADDRADIGFFAIDPQRGASIAFTAPYVLIEGAYCVRDDSPIRANDQVDRAGLRVVVGKGSAYDLYLTREIKNATLVRAPSSPLVVDTFVAEKADVAAGVRQQMEADAKRIGGLRVLEERFMVIRQAMGLPKRRGAAAAETLQAFVEELKASGFVAAALKRHGIEGASVAPAGSAA